MPQNTNKEQNKNKQKKKSKKLLAQNESRRDQLLRQIAKTLMLDK